jgi:predicted acyl esterase
MDFTSAPLHAPLEIAGHPVLSLWLALSEPDAAVFAYPSEVEADGTVRYVTEGSCAPSIAPRRHARARVPDEEQATMLELPTSTG